MSVIEGLRLRYRAHSGDPRACWPAPVYGRKLPPQLGCIEEAQGASVVWQPGGSGGSLFRWVRKWAEEENYTPGREKTVCDTGFYWPPVSESE